MTATVLPNVHMVRAEIHLRELNRWMASKGFKSQDHAMHSLLSECFGDLAPRPYFVKMPRGVPTGVLYGYINTDISELTDAMSLYADPLQYQILPPDKMESKPMPSNWREGARLGFETRIRPIVRTNEGLGDPEAKSKDLDAYIYQRMTHGGNTGMGKSEFHDREHAYVQWLNEQFTYYGGAVIEVENTKLIRSQLTKMYYKVDGKVNNGPDATMQGSLVVTDGDKFHSLVAKGIGFHRAYGYGMLLLRPVNKRDDS